MRYCRTASAGACCVALLFGSYPHTHTTRIMRLLQLVCKRVFKAKRKAFDTFQIRWRGTDAPMYMATPPLLPAHAPPAAAAAHGANGHAKPAASSGASGAA